MILRKFINEWNANEPGKFEFINGSLNTSNSYNINIVDCVDDAVDDLLLNLAKQIDNKAKDESRLLMNDSYIKSNSLDDRVDIIRKLASVKVTRRLSEMNMS